MNAKTQDNAQSEELGREASREERFFGVKHEVDLSDKKKDDDDPGITVEFEDDDASDDDRPQSMERPETRADDEGQNDDDDELKDVSDRVQKRINKLTWEKNQAKREADRIKSEREEAMRFAQAVHHNNQQLQHTIAVGEGELVRRFKDGAASKLAQAKAQFAKAYESGDTQGVIDAQEAVMNAQAEALQAGAYEQDYNWRAQNMARQAQAQMQQQQQRPAQQAYKPPTPTEEALDFQKKNPWFGDTENPLHDRMTSVALSVNKQIKAEGKIPVDSPEYYETIEREVRSVFPQAFGGATGSSAASTRRSSSPVAPASRSNGRAPRNVKLTKSQRAVAKRLGVSYEDYAAQDMALKFKEN